MTYFALDPNLALSFWHYFVTETVTYKLQRGIIKNT